MIMYEQLLLIFILLMAKHTIADYFLQRMWMIQDKSIYGAPGGIWHAAIHGIGTVLVLVPFLVSNLLAIVLALLDAVIHYHIDYVKSNIWKKHQLDNTQTLYWVLQGVDQYLHFLTYALIIYIIGA